jgi:hypothetical protein
MQKRSTLVVLAALLSIFGYFTWEHYAEKRNEQKERRHEEREGEKEKEKDRIDLAIQQDIKRTKDPNTNSVPVQRLIQARMFIDQKLSQLNNRQATSVPGINWMERGPSNVGEEVVWFGMT